MGRLLATWRAWSLQQRAALVGGVVVVVAGIGIAGYLHFKRPDDISNPSVAFKKQPKKKEKVPKTVNWPVYGRDPQRTRYLPANNIKRPFHEMWHRTSNELLEFSPIVVGNHLYYINKTADFYAVNVKTGKTIWRTDLGSLNASSPAYSKGQLFGVSLDPGQVFALSPKKGKVIWKHALPGRSETSPVVYGNDVIVGSESGDVFGLKKKNGDVDWSFHSDGAVKGGVALDKGEAFFGNYAGHFYAVDASSGKLIWEQSAEGLSFGRDGSFYSTPAVAYGRVYAGSKDSRVYSFSEKTGEIAWSHSTGAEIYPAPAVADVPGAPPTVYIGSLDHHFYALDAKTGAERWNVDVGGPILGAASVIGKSVYVSVIGPNIGTFGYDAKTGKKDWYDPLGEYNPVISDGQHLFLTGGGAIKAFEPKTPGQHKNKKHGHGGASKKQGHKKHKKSGG
jgi:outer membrane protein assembly factor BamB